MKKNWPIIVLLVVVVGIIWMSCYTDPSGDSKEQGGSYSAPVSSVATNQPADGSKKENAPKHPKRWVRLVQWPNGVETVGIMATLIFIGWQALLTRQAIASSDSAARAELRAYVGVTINTAVYQERDKEIRFECSPAVTNTGKTPAHEVKYRNNIGILKEPLPTGYTFAAGQDEVGEYVLGLNSPMVMNVIMEDYIDQQDVESIMSGIAGRALYCWGKVTYKDVFGDAQFTEFCHRMYFVANAKDPLKPEAPTTYRVFGNYLPGRNKSS